MSDDEWPQDCPWCEDVIETAEEAHEHLETCPPDG